MHSTVFPWLLLDGVLRDVVVSYGARTSGGTRCSTALFASVLQTASSAAQPEPFSSHLLGGTAARFYQSLDTAQRSASLSFYRTLWKFTCLLWHLLERRSGSGPADAAPGTDKKE